MATAARTRTRHQLRHRSRPQRASSGPCPSRNSGSSTDSPAVLRPGRSHGGSTSSPRPPGHHRSRLQPHRQTLHEPYSTNPPTARQLPSHAPACTGDLARVDLERRPQPERRRRTPGGARYSVVAADQGVCRQRWSVVFRILNSSAPWCVMVGWGALRRLPSRSRRDARPSRQDQCAALFAIQETNAVRYVWVTITTEWEDGR